MSDLDRVRQFWKRASAYPTDKEKEYPEHADIQEFGLARGKRVLEYGCGGGSDTASYVRRGAEVWFADVTPDNVTTTAIRNPTAHPLLLQSSASIDIVSSHGVLHHIEDVDPVMRELHRVLRPDGFLYMMLYTEHLWDMFNHKDDSKIFALVEQHNIRVEEAFGWLTDEAGCPYARPYSELQAEGLLYQNGFKLIWAKDYQNWRRDKDGRLTDEIISLPIFRTYKARKR